MNKRNNKIISKKQFNQRLIEIYCKYYKISVDYKITPKFQGNKNKDTVAMWLIKHCFQIPRQWMHDYKIRNKNGKILKDLMTEKDMPIPRHWKFISKMSIFDKAYFGIIPRKDNHYSDEQDDQGHTVAMLLAGIGIDVPYQWWHRADIQNNTKNTVALLQAFYGKIPDKQWEHRTDLQIKGGGTVAMRLARSGIIPPKQWEHDANIRDNIDGWTVAMLIAYYCKQIPPKQWEHDPNIQTKNFNSTVAMFLAEKGIVPPKQWWHKPALQDIDGMTTAMLIADCCEQIPNQRWNHDPNIQDNHGWTMAMILANQGIIPPQQWYHNPNHKNKYDLTVEVFLLKFEFKNYPSYWRADDNLLVSNGQETFTMKEARRYYGVQ